MENKLDSLFKKKLEEHSLPPREEAWARVEATLPKKNNVIAWRIAAALLLAGALIAAGVFMSRKNDAPTLADQSKKKKTDSTENFSRKDAKTLKNTTEEKKGSGIAASYHKQKVGNEKHPLSQKNNTVQEYNSNKDTETQNINPTEENLSDYASLRGNEKQNLNTDATAVAQTTSTPIEKPIVLEFTLEEVVADQTAVAKAETKNSGLKKMWDTARQLKNGEGPVNQLLEKKDELFALNFKKEKQKTQH